MRSDAQNSEYPICMIVDDTDMPKTGRKGEMLGRVVGSQIASISLNILQYNLLSYVKRFESYETIGGLFREITAQTLELSVTEKIWGLIQLHYHRKWLNSNDGILVGMLIVSEMGLCVDIK